MYEENNVETNNTLSYVLGSLLVVIVIVFIYLYSSYEFIAKNIFKNNYTKNLDITFDNLPYYHQSLYVKKEDSLKKINSQKSKIQTYNAKIAQLNKQIKELEVKSTDNFTNNTLSNNQKIEDLQKKLSINQLTFKTKIDDLQNEIKKYKIKISTLEKIKNKKNIKVETINKVIKEKQSSSHKTLMCTDMPDEKSLITSLCMNNINKFAMQNKNALYFEVMGYIGKFELSKNEKLKLALSNKRTTSGIWVLRKALDFKNKVLPVNYLITSKYNDHRGIVIRAYY
jgi:hypothetical protein